MVIQNTRAHIHHKDRNVLNNELSNLIPVCGSCHRDLHRDRNQRRIENKYGIISVELSLAKKDEILKSFNFQCALCNRKLTTRNHCDWCRYPITKKRDGILWQDGRVMCDSCLLKLIELERN